MRTLCVHTGGIGDLLLTGPALQCLAKDGPLELAGRPERLALLVAGGIAQKAHDLESIDFHSVFAEPSPRLCEFLSRFDRAIVWMRDDGRIVEGLRGCGVQDARAWPGLPPKAWDRHASEYYLQCLGYPSQPAQPFRLQISPIPGYDVLIHPGSGGQAKNWPLENFVELAKTLEAQGRRVTWCLGPAEEDLAAPTADCLRTESLVDLAGRLAGASQYIGNDSGITHLAAAAGCPTIAIFGPTDPRIWAPRGEHVRVSSGDLHHSLRIQN